MFPLLELTISKIFIEIEDIRCVFIMNYKYISADCNVYWIYEGPLFANELPNLFKGLHAWSGASDACRMKNMLWLFIYPYCLWDKMIKKRFCDVE